MWQKILNFLKSLFTKNTQAPAPSVRPIQEELGKSKKASDFIEPAWLAVARKELGVKEHVGDADNPRIVEYHRSTSLGKADANEDETPWCSSFVNWCMVKAGRYGTNSAWARSWLKWGVALDVPKLGCVVVFSRNTNSGHVGFFIKEVGENILVLGGNQNNEVCEALYPKSRLLGYRWPK